MYSLAFDLGTTTLVGYLIDMGTCEVIKTFSRPNPQIKYGLDILSRVSFAASSPANKDILHSCLGKEVDRMALELIEGVGALGGKLQLVENGFLVGNPVIMACTGDYEFLFPVTRLPSIANFVGADALIGAFMMEKDRKNSGNQTEGEKAAHSNYLLVDIGTNTEIVLLTDNAKLATSAAAGPAFEGGEISCGTIGKTGAIDKISLTKQVNGEPDIITHVIDEVPLNEAEGICGSGLLDLLSIMIENNVIDNTGYLYGKIEALEHNCPKKIAGRIIEEDDAPNMSQEGRTFKISDRIRVTQEDIRKLQLAISAIRAGIEVLLKERKLTASVIDKIYLAGEFGNHISIDSVIKVGMLPDFPVDRILKAGNLAGLGACELAKHPSDISDVILLKESIKTISLESRTDFKELFLTHINF